MADRYGSVRGEDAGGLAVRGCGVEHPPGGLRRTRAVELQRHTERERQIQRTDEQNVHAVLGGDLVDRVQRSERLDLDHTERVLGGVGQRRTVQSPSARSVVGGDPPVTVRRVSQVGQDGRHLVGLVQPRHHHPGRALVEHATDADPLTRTPP